MRSKSSLDFCSGWLLTLVLPASAGLVTSASGQIPVDDPLERLPAVTLQQRIVTDPASAPRPDARLSAWLAEVVKLADRGLDDSVLLPFVENTEGTFNLTPDQIIWLSARGVSSAVINAMLLHDQELNTGRRELRATTVPAPSPLLPLPASSPGTAASASAPAPAAARARGSIIVRDPSPDECAVSDQILETVQAPRSTSPAANPGPPPPPGADKTYRVRAPHPVPLTDTLVVYRCEPRVPNLLIIAGP